MFAVSGLRLYDAVPQPHVQTLSARLRMGLWPGVKAAY
jgi:hypothetical protein